MASIPVDLGWSSQGGVLMDGSGDLADTSGTMNSLVDVARSRLKSALDGWRQYQIGAGLRRALGQANTNEVEVVIKRRVVSTLTNDFLQPGTFSVNTIRLGDSLTVYVYIQNVLITSATLSLSSDSLEVR